MSHLNAAAAATNRPTASIVLPAWLLVLLVSDLPDIVLHHSGFGPAPSWLFWVKLAVIVAFALVTLVVRAVRSLLSFAWVLAVFYLALGGTGMIRRTQWFQSSFNFEGVSFVRGYCAVYALDIIVALAVIVALMVVKRSRCAIFLVKGDTSAPIEPVRWLGIKQGESWRLFGWIFALVAGLGVAVPTVLGMQPSGGMLLRALPLLPAALLFAAINAFTEEVYFRSSFLATLPEAVGRSHALLMTVLFFGLAHYLSGSPPGIPGAVMTGFLAFLLGKAMLETRGMLWPWFIHFVPDVVIFVSYALLFVNR